MPFVNKKTKGNKMKKELVLIGSMIAMSGALTSCCCKRFADVAYRKSQRNTYETAARVVNYKDGGTPGYIYPTSAEGTTLTGAQPAYQQPVRQENSCSQVQPISAEGTTLTEAQLIIYNGPIVMPSSDVNVIEAHMFYGSEGAGYDGGRYHYTVCPAGLRGCGHYPTSHWGHCR
jgi:hypothetical protein